MKNTNTWWWVGIGIVIIVLIVWAVGKNGGEMGYTVSPTPTSTASASPSATSGAATKSYQNALVTYANVRYQFDQYCQAIPKSMSVKSGRTIMLDNRSGDARVIKVGANSYSLAGYGWRLVTVSSKTLPATVYLNCGAAVNVGTLLLSK